MNANTILYSVSSIGIALEGEIAEYCKTQIYFLYRQKEKSEILELNL